MTIMEVIISARFQVNIVIMIVTLLVKFQLRKINVDYQVVYLYSALWIQVTRFNFLICIKVPCFCD